MRDRVPMPRPLPEDIIMLLFVIGIQQQPSSSSPDSFVAMETECVFF